MDAADRAAAVGTSAGNFYAYQGNMNRTLTAARYVAVNINPALGRLMR